MTFEADSESSRRDEVAAISALGDPRRRVLYDFIAACGTWVSRDQAADAAGLERGTAAHHLERLAADGLLDVNYQRLSGRQGPGAGRPAKLYRRARRDFEVSLPPRDYELAGRLLAEAADRSKTEDIDIVTALDRVAAVEGQRLARRCAAGSQPAVGGPQPTGGGRCWTFSRDSGSSRSHGKTARWSCATARSISSPNSTPS